MKIFTMNLLYKYLLLCLCIAQASMSALQEEKMPKKIRDIQSEYLKIGPGSKWLNSLRAVASSDLSIRISWDDYNYRYNYSIQIQEQNSPWRVWYYTTNERSITIYDFSPCLDVYIYVRSSDDWISTSRIESESDNVRLENGNYKYGRLAYRTSYYGYWTPGVCGFKVTTETANVVCKTICGTRDGRFYGSILRAPDHFYGEPYYYSVMYLGCRGDEGSIQNCSQNVLSYNASFEYCGVKETVGIQCFKEQSGIEQVNEFLNPKLRYNAMCKLNEFYVSFPKKENLYSDISSFVTYDQYCPYVNIENTYDNYIIRVPYDRCRTSYDGLVYGQDLTASLTLKEVGWPSISYSRDYRILILCSRGTSLHVEQSFMVDRNPSWETHIPTLINGTSIISMSAYRDLTLHNPIYVPPVFQLGTTIYIKISTIRNLDNVNVLFISSCDAYPANYGSYPYYKRSIISNGCPSEQGVAIISSHENNYAAFRMQTFRFTFTDDPIIINCTVQLVNQNSSSNIYYEPCYKTQHPNVTLNFRPPTTAYSWTIQATTESENTYKTTELPTYKTSESWWFTFTRSKPPQTTFTPLTQNPYTPQENTYKTTESPTYETSESWITPSYFFTWFNEKEKSLADNQISMDGSQQRSRYRRSIDSEFEDELHSSIPLSNFKIVILGPRVPDNLLKQYHQENATFDFYAENGAEYTVVNGLMFLKSMPKIAKKQQQYKAEELILIGALVLCLCFGITMTCLLFILVRRMKRVSKSRTALPKYQSTRSDYQPLNSKDDDT
jgi:hypothetical protein